MNETKGKEYKQPWVPGKRNFYKCKLCSSFDIAHEGGQVVKAFPGSQYVYFLYLLNWYTYIQSQHYCPAVGNRHVSR